MKKMGLIIFLLISLNRVTFASDASSPQIFIFVSFSMPKDSLQGWLREAEAVKAPVIIRGLVKSSLRETVKQVMAILPEKRGGLQVNPLLFRRFHIDKVPSVVVTRDVLDDETIIPFDVIYGDVTLSYALKKMADRHDEFAPFLKKTLQQLKEKS